MHTVMQTSLAQAFDDRGEGLVLRGHDFEWDPAQNEGTRSPHLTEDQAASLVEMVLDRYEKETDRPPKRVVIHKTSRYWPAERAGFESFLQARVRRYDLISLDRQGQVRLFPTSDYPTLRGTSFSIGQLDYLYTTGFIAELRAFHGMHVPAPIQIADHHGQDTPRDTMLAEILTLTKMNINSANLGGLMPITTRFARQVGEILREVPADHDPRPQIKFYM
jgi:hypothetical protein